MALYAQAHVHACVDMHLKPTSVCSAVPARMPTSADDNTFTQSISLKPTSRRPEAAPHGGQYTGSNKALLKAGTYLLLDPRAATFATICSSLCCRALHSVPSPTVGEGASLSLLVLPRGDLLPPTALALCLLCARTYSRHHYSSSSIAKTAGIKNSQHLRAASASSVP
eukprot:scaffold144945_cov19-Tisochrysis_lutea.AAC.2